MDEIKSALEIAMEKVAKLGEPTEEERLRWKYLPEGEKLAVKYLKESFNLAAELGKYDSKALKYLKQGALEVLLNHLNLPKDEVTKKNNRRAMDGIKELKDDKVAVENVYSRIRHIFSHYLEQGAQQRKQAYEQLKAEFEAQLQQAVQQQLGGLASLKVSVEKHPQFQEEWRRLSSQLDSQYLQLLGEYKQELRSIP